MSREQDFLLGVIEKDKVIAQQQARIEELKLALDKADPLDPSFLRYLELEQALAAERAAITQLVIERDREASEHLETKELLAAERERTLSARQDCTALGQRLVEVDAELQAEREKSAGLERQLERHATLLHNSHHNWALHSVADCPEVECEEYRALFSPAPEEK